MNLKNSLLILVGKIATLPISLLSLGAGSTWPGHVVLFLNKNFIRDLLKQNADLKVVLVAGTNGKTTTSSLIRFLVAKKGFSVFHNEEGANLLNGIASSLIRNSSFSGKINQQVAVFEVDENTLPLALKQITPGAVVILNLFRDQLDRYGEVDLIAKKWAESLQTLTGKTKVFLNADDPQVTYLGKDLKAKAYYFGLPDKYLTTREIPHDVDSVYCPQCGHKLSYYGISYSHLGDYYCTNCDFKRPKIQNKQEIPSPLEGVYNLYNLNAVSLLVNKLFKITSVELSKWLPKFKAAFGRQEELVYKGKNIFLILSKNPTGFNQSISVVAKKIKTKDSLLVVLNDRIPDGRDVSWIWDVDFENLPKAKHIYISGDRAYDMALRFQYSDIKGFKVMENLNDAVSTAVKNLADETLYVMPTYSGMLEVRKILSGRKLL